MNDRLFKLLRAMACACLITASAAAFAAAPAKSSVHVEHAWIRWLPANLPAAGYAKIVNDGDSTVRLTGASSPDYGEVMLHQSRLAEGDSTMVMVAHLDILAHGSVSLAPGGYHLMLSHAKQPVKPGDTVPVTLHFADGASVQVGFKVMPANATGPG
ncbi:MAG TPA: copper chaperone PCu(A)C [Rhodanobacteraceae bacterium]|nr:copper chaperone PCu(A)C [Rhodanobacteraceae bacterium]